MDLASDGTVGEKQHGRQLTKSAYNQAMPVLSIIIPAYNEESILGETLDDLIRSLAEADIEDVEIIVANDASTDQTAAIARDRGAIVVETNNRQIAATRNAGAAAANGQRFLFLDADTTIPAETLSSAMRQMDEGAVGCGVAIQFDKPPNLFARMIAISVLVPMRILGWAAGCCIFTTKDAFEAAGGFPEEFYATEELWFSRSLKQQGKFILLREPVVTSLRKLDTHGTFAIFRLMVTVVFRGKSAITTRNGLGWWYDGVR